jgi:hypothetical protein
VGAGRALAQRSHSPQLWGSPPSELRRRPRRDDLQDYDPFDDGGFCRSRFWLFISYIVSFGAVAGAVWVLLQDYGALLRAAGAPACLLHAALAPASRLSACCC